MTDDSIALRCMNSLLKTEEEREGREMVKREERLHAMPRIPLNFNFSISNVGDNGGGEDKNGLLVFGL